jgi:dipeptidase E
MKSAQRILLVSNSTVYGRGYLDHVEQEIKAFLAETKRILFFPYALYNRDGYAAKAKVRFAVMGYSLESVHHAADPRKAVENTDAFFVGGGNTFRLLKACKTSICWMRLVAK